MANPGTNRRWRMSWRPLDGEAGTGRRRGSRL